MGVFQAGRMIGNGITKVDLVISSNVSNYNIADEVTTALGGAPTDAVEVTVTVNSGITVNGGTVGTASMVSGTLPVDSTIELTVESTASIRGYGGQGTSDDVPASSVRGTIHSGGNAISTTIAMTIDNQGILAGGGAGGKGDYYAGGGDYGGGGGGAGSPVGIGGAWGDSDGSSSGVAGSGTLTTGGAANGPDGALSGTAGGAIGVASVVSQAGAYIVGNSLVTWTTTGTVHGVIVA